jgi:actin-like ATPase involved in cell morphogenesis
MIIDIGGGTIETAVIFLSGKRAIYNVAGDELNIAIVSIQKNCF